MDNIIMDYFSIDTLSIWSIADSSLDRNAVDNAMKVYYARESIECIYRLLYNYGFIANDKSYVENISQRKGTIYFTLNVTKMLDENPILIEQMPKMLKDQSLEIWNSIVKA